MRWALFPLQYFKWHYTVAYKDMLRIATNYLWFFWHFFSIPVLLKTFLAPWKRLGEERLRRGGLKNLLSRVVVNTLMRCVGVLIRGVTIAVGLITLVLAFAASLISYVVWTVLPFILLFLFIAGLTLIL